MSSDAELLAAWRAGDAARGAELCERYFDALYRFFRNKAAAESDIQDLVQDTLLACLGGPAFRGDSTFRTYVFTIARNALFKHHEKRGRARGDVDVGSISLVALGTSPSGIIARREEERLLLEALRSIPLDLQIALELFYWEDLSGRELAEVLGVPEGTVRTKLRRAREALDAELATLAQSKDMLASTQTDLETWARSLRDRVHPDRDAAPSPTRAQP